VKKRWCCSHEGRGCPRTTEPLPGKAKPAHNATSTPAVAAASHEASPASEASPARNATSTPKVASASDEAIATGCNAVCGYGHQAATCRERVNYLAAHPPFLGEADACARAFGRVLVNCASACSSCTLAATGCGSPPPPSKVLPRSSACSKSCTYLGKSASCGFRVQWGANHRYLGHPHACKLAHTMVLGQCSVCSNCTLAGSACVGPAPVSPATDDKFHCSDGFDNWEQGWSDAKKAWCCAEKKIACPHTSLPFDCLKDFDRWNSTWSTQKRAWCCKHRSLGCLRSTSIRYDCLHDFSRWEEAWPEPKRDFCCKFHGRGCFTTTVTSTATTSTTDAKALPATPQSYDCYQGLSRWLTGWSIEKKDWCCKMKEVCEPEPYDCLDDPSKGKKGWTKARRSWCCRHKSQGCEDNREPDFDLKFAQLHPAGPLASPASPLAQLGVVAPAALAGLGAACCFVALRRLRSRAIGESSLLDLQGDEEAE